MSDLPSLAEIAKDNKKRREDRITAALRLKEEDDARIIAREKKITHDAFLKFANLVTLESIAKALHGETFHILMIEIPEEFWKRIISVYYTYPGDDVKTAFEYCKTHEPLKSVIEELTKQGFVVELYANTYDDPNHKDSETAPMEYVSGVDLMIDLDRAETIEMAKKFDGGRKEFYNKHSVWKRAAWLKDRDA